MINVSAPDQSPPLCPRITVVGVGGAGGNAVNNMIRSDLQGVEFLVCNTDAQVLFASEAERKLRLGVGITQGLGAGANPDVGKRAAEDAIDQLAEQLDGSHMVFITAGMGGGTGTGASPVIARVAREMGMLTVGVVTKPFHFEGTRRMSIAETGLQELQQYVDTLIVIPNQNLFRIANEKTTFADAFKMADDVLHSGVRGVTDLMVMPGLINLDFADIRSVMSEMGKAMMGTGEAEGERRSITAAEAAISNPLLDDVSMKGARGVLINITGGPDITLYEVDEAANRIRDEVDPNANIIFGSAFNQEMDGKIRVSVVATGIDLESMPVRPDLTVDRTIERPRPVTVSDPQPVPQQAAQPVMATAAFEPTISAAAAGPIEPAVAPEPQVAHVATPQPAVAQAAQPAVNRMTTGETVVVRPVGAAQNERQDAAFIAPEPAQAARPASQPQQQPNRGAWRDLLRRPAARTEEQPSLTQRVTGTAPGVQQPAPQQVAPQQAAPQPHQPQQPQPAPQPQAEQPVRPNRLTAVNVHQREPLEPHKDDSLDIPAFLRRQAN